MIHKVREINVNSAGVRAAAKVKSVADLLDVDASVIRKMIGRGELEAFTIGKRGVRVFLDSVAEYQRIQSREPRPVVAERRRLQKRRHSADHEAAMKNLRDLGLID